MAFTSEYMVEIEEAQKLERELADANRRACEYYLTDESVMVMESPDAVREARRKAAKRMIDMERELADMTKQIDPYEREAAKAAINVLKRQLADMTKQRNTLTEALKSLCKAVISDEPQDITDLLKQSGAAIVAVKGGSHE
jgi:DNA-binding FrmR family transcriptional regulator